jgi:hypothetical protein
MGWLVTRKQTHMTRFEAAIKLGMGHAAEDRRRPSHFSYLHVATIASDVKFVRSVIIATVAASIYSQHLPSDQQSASNAKTTLLYGNFDAAVLRLTDPGGGGHQRVRLIEPLDVDYSDILLTNTNTYIRGRRGGPEGSFGLPKVHSRLAGKWLNSNCKIRARSHS